MDEESHGQSQSQGQRRIFEKNADDDLNHFLKRRRCLNATNIALVYLFHLTQTGGIILTSYAASANDTRLIWAGLSLNVAATLFSIYEKANTNMMQRLLADIRLIRDGRYLDEGEAVESLAQSLRPGNKATYGGLSTPPPPP